jgi:hypothetical protein
MFKGFLLFLGSVISAVIAIVATTSRDQVMTNLESWWPGLPILPTWVDPIATAISVMAAALLASAGLIKLFGVRLYPPETSASSSDNFWDRWWRGELQIAYPPVLDRHPNWPIRELFYHIRPDLLDEPDETRWIAIGRNIIDKLSTGQLEAWGRRNTKAPRLTALSPIRQSFWEDASWTYNFFADGTDHYIHAERGMPANAEQYRDVQVNRLQALRIWPKAGDEQ